MMVLVAQYYDNPVKTERRDSLVTLNLYGHQKNVAITVLLTSDRRDRHKIERVKIIGINSKRTYTYIYVCKNKNHE